MSQANSTHHSYPTNGSRFVGYLPYGEVLVEERATGTWETPYKFNGKEIDQETGWYYYGARYYDPNSTIWSGVDPLAEKYPEYGGYVYCAGNPVKYVDPDGRRIVDASGNTITYSAKSGWSKNVTLDVRRIGTAMMATPKGKEMFNKMMKAKHSITITIEPGKGSGKRNGYASTARRGDEIVHADIVIYEGMAEQTVNVIQNIKEALDNGAVLQGEIGIEAQALLDNPPINALEQMANVAAHEAEHVTNKAANVYFEPNKEKREFIANQTQIEVITQTPSHRMETIKLTPLPKIEF